MKRFFAGFIMLLMAFLATGCEKKDPNKGRVIPVGQNYKMQIWTAQEGQVIDALAKEFISSTKAAGLDISVVSFPSEDILHDALLDKMSEGKGPDVVFTTGEWVYRNKNKLVPLAQTEGFTADRFSATFVSSAGEAMVQDGEIYGVPVAVDSLALLYNEDHLIERLLDRNSPGKTWREFREDVEKLTKEDNSLDRFAFAGAAIGRIDNTNYGFEILENLMLQMGANFFTQDQTAASFASNSGISSNGARNNFGEEAVNFFTSFAKPSYKNYSWNEMLAEKESFGRDFNSFIKGKTSMVFGFSRDLETIKRMISSWNIKDGSHISEESIRTDFLPQFSDDENISSKFVVSKVLGFAVPKTAEHSNLSWNFLKFLTKKEIASNFHNETGLPTARLDLIVEQASNPELSPFVRQAKFAKNNFLPIDKSKLKDEFAVLVSEVVEKNIRSSLNLLKKMEQDTTKYLQEYLTLEKLIYRPEKIKIVPKSE